MNSAVNVVLCSSSVTLQAGVLHPKVWLQLGHVPGPGVSHFASRRPPISLNDVSITVKHLEAMPNSLQEMFKCN